MNKLHTTLKIFAVSLGMIASTICVGTRIAFENKGVINSTLGVKPYIEEKIEGDDINSTYFESEYSSLADLESAGEDLVIKEEEEGAVLLKNEDFALPLKQGDSVSLFGLASVDPAVGGKGSSAAANPTPASLPKDSFENAGLVVNPTLDKWYRDNKKSLAPSGYRINDASWTKLTSGSGITASFDEYNDAAIVMIKRVRGEDGDCITEGSDGEGGDYLDLNNNEKSILSNLSSLKGSKFKKLIVILNTPNAMEMHFEDNYDIDAILWVGIVGQSGMEAVGNILTGKVSPSGRLPDTYLKDHTFDPAMMNYGLNKYKNSDDFAGILPSESGASYSNMRYTSYVAYQEGIYVGYRYHETRYEDSVLDRAGVGDYNYSSAVAYPFGYGLSYGKFSYSNYSVSYDSKNDSYNVSVVVKNDGEEAKDVVEIYLQKPYTQYDIDNGIEKASVELVGYDKTVSLAKGASEKISISIPRREFATYDANKERSYILENGTYYLALGSSSHNAVNNILSYKGKGINDGMDEEGNPALVKAIDIRGSLDEYSKSEATGKEITNLFDYGDMNKYEGKEDNEITYISRSSWESTMPTKAAELELTDKMVEDLISQNTSDDIEEDDVPYSELETDETLNLIDLREDSDGNNIEIEDESWERLISRLDFNELSDLISTGLRKTGSCPKIAKPETKDHNGPTGLTQPYGEGANGLATKLNDENSSHSPTYYPGIGILAATFNKDLAGKVGNLLGEDALWAGYSGFYGVGVNIHRTAYDGRNFEYYSEDGFLSGKQAASLTNSLQAKGCNAYVKHIAGYEQQTDRVGLSVWSNEQAYREIYLKPFRIAIIEGGAMDAMSSYTRIGTTLCPASKELMTSFLRDECGMKGFVVSDMWNGRYFDAQLPRFILAGCDLPDGDVAQKHLFTKYQNGYGKMFEAMKLSAKRILYSTLHSNAMNGISPNTIMRKITPAWQIALNAASLSTIILAIVPSVSLIVLEIKKKKK